ncbi:hypothetical protein V5O48_006284 [Marasmius crinis-equi]|uniref:F-box domain-containing protein n=1 Tax=Marasmius crinis-equi TaxID=585013 RepID=A0ABR3FJY3_9AGAR
MRRSSRLQPKAPQTPRNDADEDEKPVKTKKTKVQPSKKVKTSTQSAEQPKDDQGNVGKRRGKRGFLEKLAREAPMDVVLEVFTHLQPLDILHLARTSKNLREMLMNRSSSPIWRAARQNIPGLPPLPAELSEPQYAALAFDSICQVCLRGTCENVIWECFIRCHKNCAPKVFYSLDELSKLKNWNNEVATMMLRGIGRGYISQVYDRKLFGDEPRYLPSIVKRLRLQYQAIQGEKELEEWECAKVAEIVALQKFSSQCEKWSREWAIHSALVRDCEDLALRRQRHDEIAKRLKALGWNDEELLDHEFGAHPLVDQTKPLTDRAWSTIEPTLVELLKNIKEKRFDQVYASRHQLLKTVYEFHCKMKCKSEYDVFPPIGDFIVSPQAKAVNDLIWNTPKDQQVTQAQFIRVLLQQVNLEEMTEEWKARIHRDLESSEEDVFYCRRCREVTWAPRLYAHKCCLDSFDPFATSVHHPKWERASEANFNPFVDFHWSFWSSSGRLEKSESGTRYRKMVQELCGASDLKSVDELDPDSLFKCSCGMLLRWTWAIAHTLPDHTLSLVQDEQVLDAARVSESAQPPMVRSKTVLCLLCKTTPTSTHWNETIQEHMQKKHGIDQRDVKRGVQWALKADTPFDSLRPKPVRLVG